MLYQLFNALTNTKGDSLPGYQVQLLNSTTKAIAPIFSDINGTPIITVSGIANTALTDAAGNYSLYVDVGTYDIQILSPSGVFLKSILSVPVSGGPPGPIGIGKDGKDGINGGVGSSAGLAALVAAAAGMAIGTNITAFDFAGYYAPGDGGGGRYVRSATAGLIAGDNANIPASIKFFASGYWWFLDLSSGLIDIRQAGAKPGAQWNATTGNVTGFDCWQAITDCIAAVTYLQDQSFYPAGYPAGAVVYTGLGKYRVGQAVNLKKGVELRGISSGLDDFNYRSAWVFGNGTDGVIINGRGTSGHGGAAPDGISAKGTRIYGMSIMHVGDIGERQYEAIRNRENAIITDCLLYWDSGNGLNPSAEAGGGGAIEGNTNGSKYDNLTIRCKGYGIKNTNKDANASYFGRIQIRTAGYGGVLDADTLGNRYNLIQVDECATNVDNGYCTYQGGRYMLIDLTPGIGGATQPGTNDAIWYPEERYQSFPSRREWAPGMAFTYSCAIGFKGAANTSTLGYAYTESYLCDATGSNATGGYGTAEWTRGSNMAGVNGNTTFYRTAPNDPMSSGDNNADFVDIAFARGVHKVLRAMRGVDNGSGYELHYVGRDLVLDNGGSPPQRYLRFTGRYTSRMGGGVIPLPYSTVIDRLLIADGSDGSNAQIGARPISPRSSVPTGGVFMQGEAFWNSAPVARAPSGWSSSGGATTNDLWQPNTLYRGDNGVPVGMPIKNGGNTYVGVLAPAWTSGETIALSDMRSSYGVNYKAMQGGVTGSRGPVGFSMSFVDGGVRWAAISEASSGATGPTGTSTSPQRDGDMWWVYQPPFTMLPTGILGAVPIAAQPDSSATTIAGLVSDFNAFLAKARTSNLMQP